MLSRLFRPRLSPTLEQPNPNTRQQQLRRAQTLLLKGQEQMNLPRKTRREIARLGARLSLHETPTEKHLAEMRRLQSKLNG